MKHIHILYSLIFGVAAVLFFGWAYPHHLHYQEQYQLFLFENTYVWDIVKVPGGTADLLGRFCTQFFLFAWVGAVIIGILLMVVQILTYRLTQWGRLYGLSFVPAFLLWIFLLDENALLGGVWAVVLTLLASWAFDKLHNGWTKRITLIAAVPILYFMVGPLCLLFFLLQTPLLKKISSKPSSITSNPYYYLLFVLLIAMPIILSHFLPVRDGSLWTGIHYHRYPTVVPTLLWLAELSVFVLTLIAGALKKPHIPRLAPVISFVVVAAGMGWIVWKNSNFKAEKVMQYDFMACHQQWNRIIDTITKEKPNNQVGVTIQNLALAMQGMLGDHMFEYRQNGTLGLLPDVASDATSPLPTAEAFYQLGMTNVAQRAVFEAQEAILDFQKSARCVKRLAQTNLINGSYDVARKYLSMLQKTLFYSDWADETLQLLKDEKAIDKHPEYGRLRQMTYNEDFFFADHVTPEMLQSLFFSNTSNRLAYEYLMSSYLLTGDLENFATYVGWGEKLGYQAIPRHFQEALALKWSFGHEKNEPMPAQVSPAVMQRFRLFYTNINSPMLTPEQLAHDFGDTYWHYYFTALQK